MSPCGPRPSELQLPLPPNGPLEWQMVVAPRKMAGYEARITLNESHLSCLVIVPTTGPPISFSGSIWNKQDGLRALSSSTTVGFIFETRELDDICVSENFGFPTLITRMPSILSGLHETHEIRAFVGRDRTSVSSSLLAKRLIRIFSQGIILGYLTLSYVFAFSPPLVLRHEKRTQTSGGAGNCRSAVTRGAAIWAIIRLFDVDVGVCVTALSEYVKPMGISRTPNSKGLAVNPGGYLHIIIIMDNMDSLIPRCCTAMIYMKLRLASTAPKRFVISPISLCHVKGWPPLCLRHPELDMESSILYAIHGLTNVASGAGHIL
ncbi:hypothetical protein CSKR_102448 [Clonorchis sinensis]|uniref:Uncharacterized protein n=1 Tax=Clonorchis sinensis TaxID=79923 RepID=A0A419QF35_CLOSI|nr:hypothetical protein CSKR_102448 [Clonorchis sinensis]